MKDSKMTEAKNMEFSIPISVVMPTYNTETEMLQQAVESILSQTFREFEFLIIDDGSTNDSVDYLNSLQDERIRLIRNPVNIGITKSLNIGLREAKGKYIFLINNDTIFKEFNVDSLINRLESSPNIGIVCPKIRFAWGTNPIQYAGYTPLSKITVRNQAIGFGEEDKCQYDTARPTPYAHGATMLIKREAIEKVGLMPEDYFLYYEEIDWSMMFTKAGYEIWYDPACTVYHKESQSTGQGSPLRT